MTGFIRCIYTRAETRAVITPPFYHINCHINCTVTVRGIYLISRDKGGHLNHMHSGGREISKKTRIIVLAIALVLCPFGRMVPCTSPPLEPLVSEMNEPA